MKCKLFKIIVYAEDSSTHRNVNDNWLGDCKINPFSETGFDIRRQNLTFKIPTLKELYVFIMDCRAITYRYSHEAERANRDIYDDCKLKKQHFWSLGL